MVTMWWQHKGSAASTSAPANSLRIRYLHQRFHHYFPRHDFLQSVGNEISDLTSFYSHITDTKLMHHFDTHLSQPMAWLV